MSKSAQLTLLEILNHVIREHPEVAESVLRICKKKIFEEKFYSSFGQSEFSYIAQNCIGGRFYEASRREYSSPTVGLWFNAGDFLEFCNDLDKNLRTKIIKDESLSRERGYPVGRLGAIRVYFQHYPDFEKAQLAWESRATRVNFNKVVILMTDRDGFEKEHRTKFGNLNFNRKILFTNNRLITVPGAIYVHGFETDPCVGNLYDQFDRFVDPDVFEKLLEIIQSGS